MPISAKSAFRNVSRKWPRASANLRTRTRITSGIVNLSKEKLPILHASFSVGYEDRRDVAEQVACGEAALTQHRRPHPPARMIAPDCASGAGGLPASFEKAEASRPRSRHSRETASFRGAEDRENVDDHRRDRASGVF